jgi:hypothetical protein
MPSRAKIAFDPVMVEGIPRLEIEPPMMETGRGMGAIQAAREERLR